MSIYENFAQVYDTFMMDTPYEKWSELIFSIWEKYNINPKLVLDLACGTGNMTCLLAKKNIDMIGIDNSDTMLFKAMEKSKNLNLDILFLNQNMQEFELYGTVDSIICICDSLNYITKENELLQIFKLVNNYLNPNGIFIFDINTIHKFKNVLGHNCFCETSENSAYTWENYFDEEEMINEFYTNFFIKDNKTNMYSRFEEFHYERAYSVDKIKNLIEKSGLKLLDIIDEKTLSSKYDTSERLFFVAKEQGKGEL